jgi:hypothetical protein
MGEREYAACLIMLGAEFFRHNLAFIQDFNRLPALMVVSNVGLQVIVLWRIY